MFMMVKIDFGIGSGTACYIDTYTKNTITQVLYMYKIFHALFYAFFTKFFLICQYTGPGVKKGINNPFIFAQR